MPMRFADRRHHHRRVPGSDADDDESGQTYPYTIESLLDAALGPEGYYGVFVANMHTDAADQPGAGRFRRR